MKFTIRKKVLVCSLFPLVLLGAIVILLAATIMKGAIIQQVENSLRGTATATQAAYDQNTGSYLETKNGDVWKGSYNISQSDNLVDTIKEESGMEVTFFYGNKRIMTSAKDKDGNRILQSEAGEKIQKEVLCAGTNILVRMFLLKELCIMDILLRYISRMIKVHQLEWCSQEVPNRRHFAVL